MPVIKDGTRRIQQTAKELVNKDTRILEGSIKVKYDDIKQEGIVYTPTEYAADQEFGTRFQRGKPYMRPAFNMHKAQIEKNMVDYLEKEMRNKINE